MVPVGRKYGRNVISPSLWSRFAPCSSIEIHAAMRRRAGFRGRVWRETRTRPRRTRRARPGCSSGHQSRCHPRRPLGRRRWRRQWSGASAPIAASRAARTRSAAAAPASSSIRIMRVWRRGCMAAPAIPRAPTNCISVPSAACCAPAW